MEFQNTIAIYEAIALLTDQMLLAAEQQDWDELIELEKGCGELVDLLRDFKNVLPLSADTRVRKAESLKHILANDSKIRDLVSPKMANLSALMNSAQNSKKLSNKYSQPNK